MPKRRFTRDLLDKILKDNKAELIEEYSKITRDSYIKYRCNCGIIDEKMMRYIVEEAGALCETCTMKHMVVTQKETMLETYGVEHPMHFPEFKKKQEDTMIENYGVRHNSLNPETIQKRKDTILEHFGVAHHLQLPEKIEERKQTYLQKYGVEHPLQRDYILEKQRQTNRDKLGVDYSLQSPEVRAKAIVTNLERYGVEHSSQNQEVMQRTQENAKKYKEYKFPSGTMRKVQGYEPFALDDLIKTYTEEQIKSDRKDVPRISYKVEEKQKYYFPDIFIPHENKIIEVKSTWTYNCKEDNIKAKAEATKNQGYKYEIWIYDGKGGKEIII